MAMENTVENTLAKYLEFRIFELFKNRLLNEITPHCREGSKSDIYRHIFICPAQLSKKRNFQLRGVLSPFVCLWRTSMLEWNNTFYARSVLPRDFIYLDKDGNVRCENGFLYDITLSFELFSSSYYRSFRDRVNQDLIDMDRLRYFYLDVKELLKDCANYKTRCEVKLTGIKPTDNVLDENNRSFDLNASYEISMSIPYCKSMNYIDAINLYLNENLIYSKDYSLETSSEE